MSVPVRRIERLDQRDLEGLVDILIDCVVGGASIGFMPPLSRDRATAFWCGVGAGVEAGERMLFVAADDAGLCGTVQLVFAQPENQPHRADLAKMLVPRRARRRGVGAALMRAAEEGAKSAGRTLLVLDTGSGEGVRLYSRMGWTRLGTVPRYALMPDGGPCASTFFYRDLASDDPGSGSAVD